MRRTFSPDRVPFEFPLEAMVTLAGMAIVLLTAGWLVVYLSSDSPTAEELRGSRVETAAAQITRVMPRNPGSPFQAQPIYVWLHGKEWLIREVPPELYMNARVGAGVVVRFRRGKSGKLYMIRADSLKATERLPLPFNGRSK